MSTAKHDPTDNLVRNKGTLFILYPVGLYMYCVLKIVLSKMFEK